MLTHSPKQTLTFKSGTEFTACSPRERNKTVGPKLVLYNCSNPPIVPTTGKTALCRKVSYLCRCDSPPEIKV